ncbi:MAG: 50S ribosomal protein L5, partial [Gemmatimonadales bacterium]|nr:50S ribosomal protein L5 [Gemmatimonadales bacterium]
MADTKEKAPKAPKTPEGAPKGGKGGGKAKEKGGAAAAVDHEPKAREGAPRLQAFYQDTVRAKLAKEFGLTNPHQVPRMEKIILNVGMGDANKNPKQLEAAVEELSAVTGQKAVVTKAKKA